MTSSKNNGKVTSAQIRKQIERTRIEMDQTLAEIQDKLDQNPLIHSLGHFAVLLKHHKRVPIVSAACLATIIIAIKIYRSHSCR
ncbi:MAG: DUF3618 domain-containing protein [Chitinivibrionales bacterium]